MNASPAGLLCVSFDDDHTVNYPPVRHGHRCHCVTQFLGYSIEDFAANEQTTANVGS